jgi:hypothetical protein
MNNFNSMDHHKEILDGIKTSKRKIVMENLVGIKMINFNTKEHHMEKKEDHQERNRITKSKSKQDQQEKKRILKLKKRIKEKKVVLNHHRSK